MALFILFLPLLWGNEDILVHLKSIYVIKSMHIYLILSFHLWNSVPADVTMARLINVFKTKIGAPLT